jgi:hypothetical protein
VVRASRRAPSSSLGQALWALLSMRQSFDGIKKTPHPEEAAHGSALCAARGQDPRPSRRTHDAESGTRRFADSLFRGGDGEEKTRLICLVCTSSKQGSGSRIVKLSTKTGGFAADLLQVQPSATIGSIHDCRLEHTSGAARLLLAGEGKALTRKAVELALAGEQTALRAEAAMGAVIRGALALVG